MFQWFKSFFFFNKSERRGIWLLLLLLIVLLAIRLQSIKTTKPVKLDSGFQHEMDRYFEALEARMKESKKKENKRNFAKDKEETYELFAFDPNECNMEEWRQLGLKNYQAEMILKYLEKGGHFYQAEDFKKIYAIKEEDYERLKPYIRIQNKDKDKDKDAEKIIKPELPKKQKTRIELNAATQDDLMQIRGIGKVYSERIIKYRDLLGGYVLTEQLLEIYGIDSSLYKQIKEYVVCDPETILTINLNTATYKTILRHPYINREMTDALLEYRGKAGKFENILEVKQINRIFDSLYIKISPYLDI